MVNAVCAEVLKKYILVLGMNYPATACRWRKELMIRSMDNMGIETTVHDLDE